MARVLVFEGDDRTTSTVADDLRAGGHTTTVAQNGDGLRLGPFDLVVVGLGGTEEDDLRVLEQLWSQEQPIPVIVVAGRAAVGDTVTALEGRSSHAGVLRAGGVVLDLSARRARLEGREVDLTARECALAEVLMRNAGQVLTREQLLDRVWGVDARSSGNVVDVYVGYLRRKLGATRILTARGLGYRFAR